uniref:Uncharacterized protein n=1 Tax=Kuenenia stuttgartiensis TaxID=174633 RepID=Q1Q7N8_KUEST|nr:unknown protein [Candidatus Kuenenia stuttgartiensis]
MNQHTTPIDNTHNELLHSITVRPVSWRGLWPQPNSKYEYRNTKQIQMTKNPMLQTLRNPHLINALRLCILKNEHKKQEVDG